MSEEKPKIEDLSRRIDELLNVLNVISRDLTDISKALKEVSTPTLAPAIPAASTEGMRSVEDIRRSFSPDLEELLIFEEARDHITIRTRRFLGSENFAKIASVVRSLGGEYVSAGKDSHFKVPREAW